MSDATNYIDASDITAYRVDNGGFGTALGISHEDTMPCTYRMARYPDGSRRIQGGYRYWSGTSGGLRWRDLLMVDVDENGHEVAL